MADQIVGLGNFHNNSQQIELSDFSGGLRCGKTPEQIADNELQTADNLMYWHNGQVTTSAGVKQVLNLKTSQEDSLVVLDIQELFYKEKQGKLFFSAIDRTIYNSDKDVADTTETIEGYGKRQFWVWTADEEDFKIYTADEKIVVALDTIATQNLTTTVKKVGDIGSEIPVVTDWKQTFLIASGKRYYPEIEHKLQCIS